MRAFWRKLQWLTRRRGEGSRTSRGTRVSSQQEEAEDREGSLEWRRTPVRALRRAAWAGQLCAGGGGYGAPRGVGRWRSSWGRTFGMRFERWPPTGFSRCLRFCSLALGIGAGHSGLQLYGRDFHAALAAGRGAAAPGRVQLARHSDEAGFRDAVDERQHVRRSSRGNHLGGSFPSRHSNFFRKQDAVFSSVFAHFQFWTMRALNVSIHGQAVISSGWSVSGEYFRGLGIAPAAGRLILPEDDRAGRRRGRGGELRPSASAISEERRMRWDRRC